MNHITVLAGGSGAAKFVPGVVAALTEEQVHLVVNVGDDHEFWGLSISPDIDSLLYALAGELDQRRGWGRKDETFDCLDTMKKLGGLGWFQIGDRDLATHLVRSQLLRQGFSLEEATLELAGRFGIDTLVMPASNTPVRTQIHTIDGTLGFQEYFVREKCRPEVLDVTYNGAVTAEVPGNVIKSIMTADRILLAPSNPVTSIGPILAIPSIYQALCKTEAGIVAISPIIGSQAVTGPAAQLMQATGPEEVSAKAVVERYQDFLDHIVIHTVDLPRSDEIRAAGVGVWVDNILINNTEDARRLAQRVTDENRAVVRKRV